MPYGSEATFTTHQTREQSLIWLETQRIPDVTKHLISLRTLRNAYTPIGSLPSEILLEIFLILYANRFYTQLHACQWSRVCLKWRSVAISTPSLWSTVDLGNQGLASMALERCHVAPVSIELKKTIQDAETPLTARLQKALASRLAVIQDVRIKSQAQTLAKIVEAIYPLPPNLTNLSLVIIPEEKVAVAMMDYSSALLAPLKRLHLNGIILPFNPIVYKDLVHLKLCNQTGSWAPSIDSFLDILASCQRLVTLDLQFAGPSLPPGTEEYPVPTREVLELGHLDSLTIEDESLTIGYLLAHMHIPQTVQLTLKLTNSANVWLETLIPRIFPLDRTHFHHLDYVNWFKFDINFDMGIEFFLENLEIHLTLDSGACAEDDNDLEDPVAKFIGPFMDQFGLDNVELIQVFCSPNQGFTTREWERVLPRLGSLRKLHYRHWQDDVVNDEFDLLRFLGNGQTLTCPTLEKLELDSIYFGKVGISWEGTERTREDLGILLVDCLRVRNAHGQRLKELVIKEPKALKPAIVTLLEQCVDRFNLQGRGS